jgi:hypothetical protein
LHYELEQVSKIDILRKLKQRFDGKTARDIRFRVEFNLTRSIVAVRRHSLEPAVTNPCPVALLPASDRKKSDSAGLGRGYCVVDQSTLGFFGKL